MSDIKKIKDEYIKKIKNNDSFDNLNQIKTELFGKNGLIALEFKKIGSISVEERKKFASDLNFIKDEFPESIIITNESEKFCLFQEADVACASSGTVTLELGLSLIPMVVIYKLDFLTWSIVSRLAKVPFISLINLVLSKNSVQELIQSNCNKKNIYKSILNLFLDKDIIENQLSDLKEFKRVIIGDKKNPSEKAASKILEYLKD